MQTLPPISCCQSFKLVFQNCCKFSGRSRRSEFFYYYTPINIIIIIPHLIGSILFQIDMGNHNHLKDKTEKIIMILGVSTFIFSLITLIPLVSLIVRRFHDTGKNGGAFIIFYIIIHLCYA